MNILLPNDSCKVFLQGQLLLKLKIINDNASAPIQMKVFVSFEAFEMWV